MKHWNDNLLCALDIETTGLDPFYNEIVQIAVIPLDSTFEWNKYLNFFDHYLRPDFPERVEIDAINTMKREDTSLDYAEVISSNQKLAKCCNEGIEQTKACDMFLAWYEKLRLKPKKRIIPLGHNLQFDMAFIKQWLGPQSYEYIFDPRWRDTQSTSLFWNDVDGYRGDRCTFKDAKLQSLCIGLKVENMKAHNAFDDALATARCYGRMVKQMHMTASIPPYDDSHIDAVRNTK